jgi:hypothetical protein
MNIDKEECLAVTEACEDYRVLWDPKPNSFEAKRY